MAYLDPDAGAVAGASIIIKERTFVESAEGTHVATVTLPGGAYLLDIQVHAQVLWAAATSASLEVGDTQDPDGYYTAVDLKATDLLADQGISFAQQGGVGGAYLVSTHLTNIYQSGERVITATVTQTGAGTAGRTRMLVIYYVPGSGDTAEATFTAA